MSKCDNRMLLLVGIHRRAPCAQVLKSKSTVVNRAPLMTAWATVVAERMGFQREEALSIGEFSSFCSGGASDM